MEPMLRNGKAMMQYAGSPTQARSLLIIVTPANGSSEQFEARLNERQLCVSRTPFFAAARALQAEGVDPNTILVMRHSGSQTDSLRARLGVAAGLTIEETKYGPKLRRWKPFSALDGSLSIAPKMPVGAATPSGPQNRLKAVGEIGERRGQKLNTVSRG
jgi:hypothetical protein